MFWTIDTAHTQIEFSVRHMMISRVRGKFSKFNGEVVLDEQNPANTSVNIQVELASIDTNEPNRDNHLRSADFFDVENHPHMTFTSKRVEVLDSEHARLYGDLTIRGVTREVPLEVTFEGKALSPWGNESYGFSGAARINRKDWGLTWNQALETGGVLVSDTVEINIQLELIKQTEAAAA